MKKKNRYQQNTLTAKERKEQRRLAEEKQSKKSDAVATTELKSEVKKSEPESDVIGAVETGFGQAVMSRNKLWVIIAAGFMALIMILFAILIPTVIAPSVRFGNIPHTVVVFQLSTREQIEIIVYDDAMPHTATNFVHLARMGFFNDTVIFDTSYNFVRFGQYEDTTFRNFRTRNQSFINRNVRNMTLPDRFHGEQFFDGDSPFDFRINETPISYRVATRPGYISAMHTFSGTDFQISAGDINSDQARTSLPNNRTGQTDSLDVGGRVFGHVTPTSMEVIERIAARDNRGVSSAHPFFIPPREAIRIVNTRVYNLDFWGKWRTFSWDNYFQWNSELQSHASIISWVGGSSWRGPNSVDQLA